MAMNSEAAAPWTWHLCAVWGASPYAGHPGRS